MYANYPLEPKFFDQNSWKNGVTILEPFVPFLLYAAWFQKDKISLISEGPKRRPEGVNGSQLKFSSGKVWPKIPNAHHKPSLLECAQCSYSWARHKAQTLGTRCEEIESRTASKQQRKHGIWAPVKPTCEEGLHRFNRRHRAGSKRKASTGWSDKIKCQRRCSCPETPQNGLKEYRLNRWKQSPSVGAVVQRDYKTNRTEHRLNRRWWTSIRRCNEQNSTQGSLVKLHRLNRCMWN